MIFGRDSARDWPVRGEPPFVRRGALTGPGEDYSQLFRVQAREQIARVRPEKAGDNESRVLRKRVGGARRPRVEGLLLCQRKKSPRESCPFEAEARHYRRLLGGTPIKNKRRDEADAGPADEEREPSAAFRRDVVGKSECSLQTQDNATVVLVDNERSLLTTRRVASLAARD